MLLKAFAKVNLILKITNKNEFGYHNLQMINSKIDIYDEIEIVDYDKDIVEYQNISINKEDDIVLKALTLFKEEYCIKDSYKIIINKNIPVGAGMGGGSSDVACIIKYLSKKYNVNIDNRLINILKKVGTDIIYLLYDGVRYVEGIGDIISNDKVDIDEEFVIVNPNIFIPTKEVFKINTKYSGYIDKNILIENVKNKEYVNDLEEASFKYDNRLYILKNILSKIGKTVMSGSGSTMMVFGSDIEYIYNECKKIDNSYYIRKVKLIKE